MHKTLWNPVGVQINANSFTWGAPQSGDPRLCCETRSGLNHRISLQIILHGVAFQGFHVRYCRFLGRCPSLSHYAALRQPLREHDPCRRYKTWITQPHQIPRLLRSSATSCTSQPNCELVQIDSPRIDSACHFVLLSSSDKQSPTGSSPAHFSGRIADCFHQQS